MTQEKKQELYNRLHQIYIRYANDAGNDTNYIIFEPIKVTGTVESISQNINFLYPFIKVQEENNTSSYIHEISSDSVFNKIITDGYHIKLVKINEDENEEFLGDVLTEIPSEGICRLYISPKYVDDYNSGGIAKGGTKAENENEFVKNLLYEFIIIDSYLVGTTISINNPQGENNLFMRHIYTCGKYDINNSNTNTETGIITFDEVHVNEEIRLQLNGNLDDIIDELYPDGQEDFENHDITNYYKSVEKGGSSDTSTR